MNRKALLVAGAMIAWIGQAAITPLQAAATTGVILGDTVVESYVDSIPTGVPEAYVSTAASSATIGTLTVYVDPTSTAIQLVAGLYADNAGHPGSLLTQGSLSAPVAGWNNVVVPTVAVTTGQLYWIAVLTPSGSGTLVVRDRCCGVGQASETAATAATLPATWATQGRANNGPLSAYGSTQPVPPPTTDQVGQWGAAMNWPLVAVHSTLMSTGDVLMWDAWETPSLAQVWHPSTQTFTSVTNASGLFCAAQVTLGDGRVLVGGGFASRQVGIKDTNIFNPTTGTWTRVADMNQPRWYPSMTALGDGRAVIISGNIDPTHWAENPEVYNPATNTWTLLSGVSTPQVHELQYPLSSLLPNGKVFIIAQTTGEGLSLDVNAQTLTSVGFSPVHNGSSAIYRPGKILYTGGGDRSSATNPAQPTASVIDMTSSTPAWRQVAPMAYGRDFHTLVDLPDGKVLAVGGSSLMSPGTSGVLPAEMWDPTTETWTTLSTMSVPRIYHSTAVLMPDGRVLVAGSGHEYQGGPGQYSAQYYSPPYMFKGSRPSITAAPATTSYGATMTVQTPDAAGVTSVSLVALAGDTHTQDMNQRFIPLSFTAGSGSLSVQAPSSSTIAPAGDYMLFILNASGVPSVAKILQVNGSPAAPSNVVATGANASATVSWTAPGNGGSPISSYTVTPSAGATALPPTVVTGTPPPTSTVVTGLTNATTYTFTVSATNAIGTGPPSQASNSITPSATATVPGSPLNVTVTTSTSGTVVSWSPPADSGSPLTQYMVTPYIGSTAQPSTTVTGSPPATTVNLTGLTGGATYTFTVSATNAVGTGPPSAPSSAVTVMQTCPCTVYGAGVPALVDSGDGRSIEVGLKFRSEINGFVSGIRFYKATANGGIHIGNLWSSSGTLLASVTFAGETASGWQQMTIPGGVAVTANTTYVVSYFAPQGHNSVTVGGLTPIGVDNPPLHALANGVDGPNGLYLYNAASAFPNNSYNSNEYWVDVTFSTTAPPAAAPAAPGNVSATAGNGAVTVTWSAPNNGGSPITRYTVTPYIGSTPQPATTLTGSPPATSATIAGLANGTAYTFDVSATNSVGTGADSGSNPVTPTMAGPSCPCASIYGSGVPVTVDSGETSSLEVGVKFRSDVAGYISGIRFYKAAANGGTHLGHLWSSSGTLLASVVFTGETASGWQQVRIAGGVAIAANTTYVVSYLAPQGHNSVSVAALTTAGVDSPPLHALANGLDGPNGLYLYAPSGGFPTNSYNSNEYWVDAMFSSTAPPPTVPDTPGSVAATAGNGAATITWTAPANGGSAITQYTVTPYIGSTAQPVTTLSGSPPSTSATISGLTNGTAYTFAVTATNAAGTSAAGTVGTSSTPTSASPICPCSSVYGSGVPVTVDSGETSSLEVGVKFRSDVAGYISGIRFYKAAANGGTHIGNLWTSSGTLLASVVFSSETATGWQQVRIPGGVAIAANTTYVVSYFAPQGHNSVSVAALATAGVDGPPLHALANGVDGPNGLYLYAASSGFPTSSYNSNEYWVDVIMSATAPAASAPDPPGGVTATAGNAAATITWTAPASGGSAITQYTVTPYLSSTAQPPITVTGSPPATSVTVAGLTNGTAYSFAVTATNAVGSSAAASTAGTATPTAAGPSCPCASIFGSSVPLTVDSGDASSLELGVKFRSDVSGYISGIRFYKATSNGGTHIGHLWTSSGTLLASVVFTSETASGWQQVSIPGGVAVTANTTYIASYFDPQGHYSVTATGLATAVNNPPLHALANGVDGPNGLFRYGASSGFPTNSYNANEYWVDVLFSTTAPAATPPGSPEGVTATAGNGVVTVSWTAASTGGSAITQYTVTPYIGATAQPSTTVTGSPPGTSVTVAGLINGTPYSFAVAAINVVGSSAAASTAGTVTPTAAGPSCPCASIFGSSLPLTVDSGDASSLELGGKFRSDVSGYISGIRFYKATANGGTHVGSVWTSSGTLLATVTFTNETASGWQQARISGGVAITANTTYVVSYFDPQGHYSVTATGLANAGVDSPPLHALANGVDGPNGLFRYGAGSGFPTSSYNGNEYWVDVIFSTTAPVAMAPVTSPAIAYAINSKASLLATTAIEVRVTSEAAASGPVAASHPTLAPNSAGADRYRFYCPLFLLDSTTAISGTAGPNPPTYTFGLSTPVVSRLPVSTRVLLAPTQPSPDRRRPGDAIPAVAAMATSANQRGHRAPTRPRASRKSPRRGSPKD